MVTSTQEMPILYAAAVKEANCVLWIIRKATENKNVNTCNVLMVCSYMDCCIQFGSAD